MVSGVQAPAVRATVVDLADGADRWAELSSPATFYLDGGWMAAMSSTVSDRPRLVLATDGAGRPLAGFPVHVQTPASYHLYDPWRALDGVPGGAAAGEPAYPVVTSVAPGFEAGVRWAGGLDRAAREAALAAALDGMEALAAEAGAPATAFLYVPDATHPLLEQALAARGYASAVVGADARLAVRWGDFEEYVETRGKRRRSVRAEVRRFQEAGSEVRVGGAGALTDDLAPLHAEWRAKHGSRVTVDELRRLYAAVRAHAGPAMRMFVARRDGRPVAFSQFYEHDGVLYSRAVGFHYAAVEDTFAYFNLLFYEPLRWAMANGVREIRYSMGSDEAKVARGCDLVPLRCHVRTAAGGGR